MSVLAASFDKSNHWKKCAKQWEVHFTVLFPLPSVNLLAFNHLLPITCLVVELNQLDGSN